MGRRNFQREEEIARDWGKVSIDDLAARYNTSRGSITRSARRIGLKPVRRRQSLQLKDAHEAVKKRTTLFPGTIADTRYSPRLLVPSAPTSKLGSIVSKGRWKGMRLFALTLTERASCPTRCKEWSTCYGNNMPLARRHILGPGLRRRLERELAELASERPQGFVVRLHVLGDFGRNKAEGMPYVEFWHEMLDRHKELRIFGYTAHDPDKDVGSYLHSLNLDYPDRCRIRFSGTVDDEGFGSIVIDKVEDSKHVVCPVETGKSASCSTCGLCWTMAHTVEFVRH